MKNIKTILKAVFSLLVNGKYYQITCLGVFIWVGENIYFGFNAKPINGIEAMLDNISMLLIFWGIIGDILQGVVINKTTNENYKITNIMKKGAYHMDLDAAKFLIKEDEKEDKE